MKKMGDEVLGAQLPVLGWWALATVITRAATTLTMLSILILGVWFYLHDLTTVGEIVTFMGYATLMIGKLEQAVHFANHDGDGSAAGAGILRRARHRAGGARPSRCGRSRPAARLGRVQGCLLLLRRQARRGRRSELHRAAGRNRRAGRRYRRGEIDRACAAAPRLRPAIGRGEDRRHGHSRVHAVGPAAQYRRGVPGGAAVQPLGCREPARRQAGRERGGDAQRLRARAGHRRHRAQSGRLRGRSPASADACSRAASASGCRSRARC